MAESAAQRRVAARPALGAQVLPGVVQAHGLGGFAEESHATGTAALLQSRPTHLGCAWPAYSRSGE